MEFQVVDWFVSDEIIDDDCPEEYVIRAFGETEDGESVCCSIRNYRPYFYVKCPGFWKMENFRKYITKLKSRKFKGKTLINYYIKDGLIVNDCVIEEYVPYYGFCNMEKGRFIKLVFSSQKSMKGYMYALKSLHEVGDKDYLELYDNNVETLLKFFHEKDIQPSNHIKINKFYEEKSSRCKIDIECDYKEVISTPKEYNNPILQASYDIETYSLPKIENGKKSYPFPIPEIEEDVIYQIATCFKRVGAKDFHKKYIFTLKKSAPLAEDIILLEYQTERELLLGWINMIIEEDPSIIYSYNGDMFDGNYVAVRCKMNNLTTELTKLSRLQDYKAELVSAKFSSSAYGTSEYNRLSIPGRINFDILIFIRREFKENSYKLDNIAEKYLKEKKNPVTVQEIFGAYESGLPEEIAKIASYCVQDTLLPQKLVDVLYILQTQISMSNVTKVTIRMLIERGQEVKAVSQIRLISRRKGFIMQNCNYKTEQEGFEGATVLDPNRGIYDCITTLDFEGLYPSIIRAHNLCPTSIVLNKDYLNIEGCKYTKVKFAEGETAIFVENTQTVLPDLLYELTMERKKYKKLMAKAEDKDLKEIYNRTQLAFKISSNSIYGILGSKTYGCRPIAATVTYYGRTMIKDTKEYIEKNHHTVYPVGYNSTILDGNSKISVKVDGAQMEVLVKDLETLDGTIEIETVKGWREFYDTTIISD